MKDFTYCALCSADAVKMIPETMTALCSDHATAYTWGQSSLDTEIPENRQLIEYRPPTLNMFAPEPLTQTEGV